jgi:chromosome segregation ATPase
LATAPAQKPTPDLSLDDLTRQRESEQGKLRTLETDLASLETKLAEARERYKQQCRELDHSNGANPQKLRTEIDVLEVRLEDVKREIATREAGLVQLSEACSNAFAAQQRQRDVARLGELEGLIAAQDQKLNQLDDQYDRERTAAAKVRVELWWERGALLQRRQTPVQRLEAPERFRDGW